MFPAKAQVILGKQGRIHGQYQSRTGGQGHAQIHTNFPTLKMPKNAKKAKCDRPKDGRTDGRTDQPTDRPTR